MLMSYQEWRKQLKAGKRVRSYQHFDNPLNLDNEIAFRKVINTIEDIKNHQFLPFLKKDKKEIRFRRNKEGKTVRSVKIRPIMFASHLDAHIYSYYNYLLYQEYEDYLRRAGISEQVIAYRKVEIEEEGKGKSNIHFAKEAFDYVKTLEEPIVITQDIEKFFDEINHKILKERICRVGNKTELDESFYKVYKSLTLYKYVDYADFIDKELKKKVRGNKYAVYRVLKDIFRKNLLSKAIPQGSPISGLLANIYLIDFDLAVKEAFPNVFYRRYSDDLIFVCSLAEKDKLLEFIYKKIEEHLLKINPQKSFISYFYKKNEKLFCSKVTNGLDKKLGHRDYISYLGFEFNGDNTLLRKATIQRLKHKQLLKAKKQLLNTLSQKRRKPKKKRNKLQRGKSNYLRRSSEIIGNEGIKNQVLKVAKDRNKVKKIKQKL